MQNLKRNWQIYVSVLEVAACPLIHTHLFVNLGMGSSLSDDDMRAVRAFNLYVDTCMPAQQYGKISLAFPEMNDLPSLFRAQGRAARLSGIKPVKVDCCMNSCCAYTEQYRSLSRCPFCKAERYGGDGKPRKQFSYLPITDRLTQLFALRSTADVLDYRAEHDSAHRYHDKICDIFDGQHYQTLRSQQVSVDGKILAHKHFSDRRDIALGLSVDGFCPFKKRKQTCWPIILFNYNLPPDIRFHLENIICVGVIPGPTQMKDIDSFLALLIAELKLLAAGVRAFDVRSSSLFSLHAYLILAFGDIPAAAKLMRMKGHNAKSPCRACHIEGIRIPHSSNKIHYIPLYRSEAPYDPLALPLRNHHDFLSNAAEVLAEPDATESNELAKKYGIKGVPILAALSSISLPGSFPYDFMHLIWENVIPTLVLLWTKKMKPLKDEGRQPYHIKKSVWEAIGEATVDAGATLPSGFGCRVPNIAKSRSEFTAEAWSMWTLFIGPVLLKRQFTNDAYYKHFVELVRLINICLRYEMKRKDVPKLRIAFAEWVHEYER